MNFSPNNPVPAEGRAKIAELLPRMTADEVASIVGCHSATVIRIARKMGLPIRRRGCNLPPMTPSVWLAYKRKWPFQPRGQAPLNWLQT